IMHGVDNHIYGLFGKGNYIHVASYRAESNKFQLNNRLSVKGLPFPFSNFGIVKLNNNKYLLLFAVREQGVFSAPKDDPNRYGYNVEGFWTFPLMRLGIYGAVLDNLDTQEIKPMQLTSLDQAFFAINGFSKY